jgi:pyruvate,water dikinase
LANERQVGVVGVQAVGEQLERRHGHRSNDLTQLILGVDRDAEDLAGLFDERNEALMSMFSDVIRKAHAAGIKIGICGQGPSDHPDFAAFLVRAGIDSLSLNPDSFLHTLQVVAQAESRT